MVGLKDAAKFVGIIIVACCAVFVCSLFLNYDVDLRAVGEAVGAENKPLYDALLLNNKVVCLVSGLCLALSAVVMLAFYIGQFIESHSDRFGVMKALGYSNLSIAARCAVFGFCVLIGCALGYVLSWTLMAGFYDKQNEGSAIPQVILRFHPEILLLVIVPTVVFCALSVGFALLKLRAPALDLIKGNVRKQRKIKPRKSTKDKPFLCELALSVLNGKKLLAFFVAFGSFCFGSMTQMGVSMRTYASDMMGAMILIIGLVLAATSLYLAMSTVVNGNSKPLAMLKVSGYGVWESSFAVLGLYRIPAYIGFAIGSVYQWGLLNIMVNIVFGDFGDVPQYSFDWAVFGVCLAAFFVAYELLTLAYTFKISKTPVKVIMSE